MPGIYDVPYINRTKWLSGKGNRYSRRKINQSKLTNRRYPCTNSYVRVLTAHSAHTQLLIHRMTRNSVRKTATNPKEGVFFHPHPNTFFINTYDTNPPSLYLPSCSEPRSTMPTLAFISHDDFLRLGGHGNSLENASGGCGTESAVTVAVTGAGATRPATRAVTINPYI